MIARPRGAALQAAGMAVALVALPSVLAAEPAWDLEVRVGGAWSAPIPIVIRQEGQEDLRFTAHWETDALETPVYYAGRLARWDHGAAWALGLVHHKLTLDDPPAEVTWFSITHGYNLLTLERLWERDRWRYGVNLGAVLAHPESEIRGRRLDENRGFLGTGEYLAGPTAGVLVSRWRSIGGLRATAEAQLTFSFAHVPVADGSAQVPNLAVHASVGLGWWLGRPPAQPNNPSS